MRTQTAAAALVGWLLAATAAPAADLKLGDPAPPLKVAKFVKGEPVATFEPGKVYVVEFWATWCVPCRETIPHLTKLQKQYPDVTIIGVSIAESDAGDVGPFVARMGDQMGYRVAADLLPGPDGDLEGTAQEDWMEAADQEGIPTAFLVGKDGRIAWIGGPKDLDGPLDRVVRGTFDLKAEVADARARAEKKARIESLAKKIAQAPTNSDEAIGLLDEAFRAEPAMEERLGLMKFRMMAARDDLADKAAAYGRKIVKEKLPADAILFGGIAWVIVDPDRPTVAGKALLAFALEMAREADKLAEGKDAAAADSLGRALFLTGEPAQAVAAQERAVTLAKGTELEQDEGLAGRLAEYRKAAAAKK